MLIVVETSLGPGHTPRRPGTLLSKTSFIHTPEVNQKSKRKEQKCGIAFGDAVSTTTYRWPLRAILNAVKDLS
jgi:hypothetical protein